MHRPRLPHEDSGWLEDYGARLPNRFAPGRSGGAVSRPESAAGKLRGLGFARCMMMMTRGGRLLLLLLRFGSRARLAFAAPGRRAGRGLPSPTPSLQRHEKPPPPHRLPCCNHACLPAMRRARRGWGGWNCFLSPSPFVLLQTIQSPRWPSSSLCLDLTLTVRGRFYSGGE